MNETDLHEVALNLASAERLFVLDHNDLVARDEHLATCRMCSGEVADWRRVEASLRGFDPGSTSSRVRTRVQEAIVTAKRTDRRPVAAIGQFAAAAAAAVVLAVTALTFGARDASRLDAGAQEVSLPTLADGSAACRGVGIDATLTGSPDDPRVAWLRTSQGARLEVVWPQGYRARFNPTLEVLDANGQVVTQAGARFTEACVAGPPVKPESLLLLQP